jgi:hypothetical protein
MLERERATEVFEVGFRRTPGLPGWLTNERRGLAPQLRIRGIFVTTSPTDRGRFVSITMATKLNKNCDMPNSFPGKVLGRGMSQFKNCDMRKSFPCKAVTPCRYFRGYSMMRASFAPRQTTE